MDFTTQPVIIGVWRIVEMIEIVTIAGRSGDTEITDDAPKQVLNWLEKHESDIIDIAIRFRGLSILEEMDSTKNRLIVQGCNNYIYFCPNPQCSLGFKPLFCYANQQTLRAFTEEGSVVFTIV
jgi:hypothetical protein